MSQTIEINGRKIGPEYIPLVIAELGINHNGSLELAKEMVDSAQRAGVEIIKHQTHIVEDEMSEEAKKIIPKNSEISIYEIMERCSLNLEEEIALQEYILNKGILFISTPFSRAAVDRLVKMRVPAFKIGSGECNNYPLVDYIASFNKPIILSTGMNTIQSIHKAVRLINKHKTPYAVLHTTNLYPTPNHLVRLNAMVELSKHFPDVPFGLSDHTTSNHACIGAMALGASIVERHFTDNMSRQGPDIICSMDEATCAELIESSKIIFEQRGDYVKEPVKEEQVTIDFAFATVVSTRRIIKGEILTRDNIWVRRPGKNGIPAEEFEKLLGKKAACDIEKNIQIKWEFLEQ